MNKKRPTSPHLGIYKWQISSVLSILHRITGVAIFVGCILLCWLIVFTIFYPEILEFSIFNSFIFKLMLFGWSFALYYHLLNGIRHLFWDMGYGFDLIHMKRSGYIVVFGSIFLTLASWMVALI